LAGAKKVLACNRHTKRNRTGGGIVNESEGNNNGEFELLQKPATLGAIPGNQKQILNRTGKYA
jgi:hypothetical protein